MRKFLSFILAITLTASVFCCNASAENDNTDDTYDIQYNAMVDQKYFGFKDNVYKTTDFGGHEIRSDAHVTSVDEFKSYMSQFFDDETISQYDNYYDERLFDENVVFLNTIYQGSGTSPLYYVRDVKVTDEGAAISGRWDYREDLAYADVVSVLFVQVVIPKNEYHSENFNVTWTAEEWADVTYDTPDVYRKDESPVVITSVKELNDFYDRGYNVNLHLQYNNAFFDQCVVVIKPFFFDKGDIKPIGSDTGYVPYNDVINIDTVFVYSDYVPGYYEDTDPVSEPYYEFLYEEIPKTKYHGQEIEWNIKYDLSGYFAPWSYDNERKWEHGFAEITSADELSKYYEKFGSEDNIRTKPEKTYDDEFFKDNMLLMNAVYFDFGEKIPSEYKPFEYKFCKNQFDEDYCYVRIPAVFDETTNENDPFYDVYAVEVPKNEYKANKTEWSFADVKIQGKAQGGIGNKVYQIFTGYNDILLNSEPQFEVVNDTQSIKDYLSKYYSEDIVNKYSEIYNELFFSNNNLIIGSIVQGAGTEPLLSIDEAYFELESYDSVFINYYHVNGHLIQTYSELPALVSVLLVCIPVFDQTAPVEYRFNTSGAAIETLGTYGDINKDGKVTLRDSMKIQRSCIGLDTLDDNAKLCADVNKDDRVSNADALEIQRHCVNAKATKLIGQPKIALSFTL